MTTSPQVVGAEDLLEVAARRMARLGIRHLPVVGADGALVGVVTDAAVFSRGGLLGAHDELWVAYDAADEGRTCGDVAEPATTARADDDVGEVLGRLADGPIDAVVVVDELRRPIGIVTEHDGVRLAVGLLPDASGPVQGGVLAVTRDAPAAAALQSMSAHRVRHVLVLEPDGRLYGVVSLGDLITDQVWTRRELTAEDVVRGGRLITARAPVSLRHAAEAMVRHKVGCVPVVDDLGRPRALLTRRDVLRGVVAHRAGR